jgi:hypothetical protein
MSPASGHRLYRELQLPLVEHSPYLHTVRSRSTASSSTESDSLARTLGQLQTVVAILSIVSLFVALGGKPISPNSPRPPFNLSSQIRSSPDPRSFSADHWVNLSAQLPRLFALLVIGAFTERAFAPALDRYSPKVHGRSVLRDTALCLQFAWFLSELAFFSALAPFLVAVNPALPYTPAGALALRAFPASAMVTLSGCMDFFNKLRRRRRHRRLSSMDAADFRRLTCVATSTGDDLAAYSPSPPLSPADSFASGSTGGMASGLPSPTGHCPSPDRAAALRHGTASCGDIYLMQHILDTNESMMFVHKVLRPIKTRIDDYIPPPPAPAAVAPGGYKPLLAHLKTYTQKPMKSCPPIPYPAVTATVTLVRPKGVGAESVMPPPGLVSMPLV